MTTADVDLKKQLREQAKQLRAIVGAEIQKPLPLSPPLPTAGNVPASPSSSAATSPAMRTMVATLKVKVPTPSPSSAATPSTPIQSSPLQPVQTTSVPLSVRTTIKLTPKLKGGPSAPEIVAPKSPSASPRLRKVDDDEYVPNIPRSSRPSGPACTTPAAKKKAAKKAEPQVDLSQLSSEMRSCWNILTFLRRKKDAAAFLRPVDLTEYPHYTLLVKEPMDLWTVGQKIGNGQYATIEDFRHDMMLIWENCRAFNPPGHPILKCAREMELSFLKRYEELEADVQTTAEVQAQEEVIPEPVAKPAPVLDPVLEEKIRPLQDQAARLRAELEDLRRNPALTIGDAKVVEAANDEPLQFGEIRRLNKMLYELASDSDVITRVVQMIRKDCPKAVAIKDGELVLDTTILRPSLAREVYAICEKALTRGKKRRPGTQDAPPPKRPNTDSVCSGGSDGSEKSTKSNSSSFWRENLAAPNAAAGAGVSTPKNVKSPVSNPEPRPKPKSPVSTPKSHPKPKPAPRASPIHSPLPNPLSNSTVSSPYSNARGFVAPPPFSPATTMAPIPPFPSFASGMPSPGTPSPVPPVRGPALPITNPFAMDALAHPPQLYQQALSQILAGYNSPLAFGPSLSLPSSAPPRSPRTNASTSKQGHMATTTPTPPTPSTPASTSNPTAVHMDTSVEPLALPSWITS